jgi:hypothetical protein
MSALTRAIRSHTHTSCLTFAGSFRSLCHTLEDHRLDVIRSHSQCAALRPCYRHGRCGLRRCSLQRKRRRCSRLRETGQKCGGAQLTPTVSTTECAVPRTRASAALGGVDQRALRLTWHPHLDTEDSGTPTCRRGVGPSWWMARESITCSRRSLRNTVDSTRGLPTLRLFALLLTRRQGACVRASVCPCKRACLRACRRACVRSHNSRLSFRAWKSTSVLPRVVVGIVDPAVTSCSACCSSHQLSPRTFTSARLSCVTRASQTLYDA